MVDKGPLDRPVTLQMYQSFAVQNQMSASEILDSWPLGRKHLVGNTLHSQS